MDTISRTNIRLTFGRKLALTFGMLGVCLGAVVVVGVSSSAASSAKLIMIVVGVLGLVLALVSGFLISRQLTGNVRTAQTRLDQIAGATSERLRPAIQALADGDLTVELAVKTKAVTGLPDNEIGDIMRTGEQLRDVIIDCYTAYNQAVSGLRKLVTEVSTTAVSIGDTSEQTASTSDETGKATADVARAIGNVAQGAERQVQMIGNARSAAEDVAAAVEQSAHNAEQTVEVAGRARETAQHGVDAAEQADAAMRSVKDSSEAVTLAIHGLSVAKMEQSIGEVAAVAEQSSASTEQVSASTEQTSASTEQVAASAAEMAGNADALRRLVAQFQLR
ncbi:MAG: hypothetical protein ACLP01_06400 [Solirubrobacteraceae bacterium]